MGNVLQSQEQASSSWLQLFHHKFISLLNWLQLLKPQNIQMDLEETYPQNTILTYCFL